MMGSMYWKKKFSHPVTQDMLLFIVPLRYILVHFSSFVVLPLPASLAKMNNHKLANFVCYYFFIPPLYSGVFALSSE